MQQRGIEFKVGLLVLIALGILGAFTPGTAMEPAPSQTSDQRCFPFP